MNRIVPLVFLLPIASAWPAVTASRPPVRRRRNGNCMTQACYSDGKAHLR